MGDSACRAQQASKPLVDRAAALNRAAPTASSYRRAAASDAIGPSCERMRRPQSGDQRQDVSEHLLRHRDLAQLERHVATVAADLRADLDELLAQARQRLRLRRLRHCQRPHEMPKL